MFKKAVKKQIKLRLALTGPSGSGKTYTSLQIAQGLDTGKGVAVVDTEHGSASRYANLFSFDVAELTKFNPDDLIKIINLASKEYDVLIIDSLSHFWIGSGGILDILDQEAKKVRGNSFAAWKNVTPKQNELVNTILSAKCHIIATLRVKTEYSQEKDEQGKSQIKKIGLAPVQREGIEYEFDVIGDLSMDNSLVIAKSRIPALSGKVFRPNEGITSLIKEWLEDGVEDNAPYVAQIKPLREALKWSSEQFLKWLSDNFEVSHPKELEIPELNRLISELQRMKEEASKTPKSSEGEKTQNLSNLVSDIQ